MSTAMKASLMAAGLYFVVANPITYDLVERIFGGIVTVKNAGGPTQVGTALHAVVYGLLTFLIMLIADRKKTAGASAYERY